MVLTELAVRNFRSIKEETFCFPPLAILIGKNNSGKTNVLEAARILLEGTAKDVSVEDFFDPSQDIEIGATFSGVREYLPLCEQRHRPRIEERIADADRIVVRRTVDAITGKLSKIEIRDESGEFATPTGIDAGLRTILPEVVAIMPLDDPAEEAKAKGTKTLAKLLKQILQTVQSQVQPQLDEAYSQANSLLNVVELDQDGRVVEHDDRVPDLQRIESVIASHLQETFPRAMVRLRVGMPAVAEIMGQAGLSVLEGGVETAVEKQGHGVQRALYLSLLQTLAEELRLGDGERLFRPFIVLIEEPELFLHPSAQERMRLALETISARAQVLLATHSPLMVSPSSLRQLVVLDRRPRTGSEKEETLCRSVLHREAPTVDERDLVTLLNLQRSATIFFSDKVVLVEGISDWYLLDAMAHRVTGKPLNRQGIGVVEVGGKDKLVKFKRILESLGLEVSAIADLDFLASGAGEILQADALYSRFCEQVNSQLAALGLESPDTEGGRRQRKAAMADACRSDLCGERDQLCETLRSEGIYVLREGEMHEYVGLSDTSKGRYLLAAHEVVDGAREIVHEDEIVGMITSIAGVEPLAGGEGS